MSKINYRAAGSCFVCAREKVATGEPLNLLKSIIGVSQSIGLNETVLSPWLHAGAGSNERSRNQIIKEGFILFATSEPMKIGTTLNN